MREEDYIKILEKENKELKLKLNDAEKTLDCIIQIRKGFERDASNYALRLAEKCQTRTTEKGTKKKERS